MSEPLGVLRSYTSMEIEAIVAFCSEEVRRQGRGPLEVGHMVNAWLHAIERVEAAPTVQDVELWGLLVEPEVNQDGFRRVQVYVGDHVPPTAQEVPELMDRYAAWYPDMDADQAYLEFERIHPFGDGNGRVGKILYNLKLRRLRDPIWPPDFFGGIANP